MILTFDGDQFELDLYPGEPWNGRSPRVLTRVGEGLFLRPEPPRHEVIHVCDPNQLDLWREKGHTAKKAPRRGSRGAPSLLPLKETRGRRGSRRVLPEIGD